MASSAFLTLQGKQQGNITGSVVQKGHEGSILVIEARHEVLTPMSDAGSGAAVGKRVHKPFVVTKELDRSTPLLYQAMIKSELLTAWELKFYLIDAKGVERQQYIVTLKNARITDIRFVMPNTKDAATAKLNPYEEVEFVYSGIEWNWAAGGIITSDQL